MLESNPIVFLASIPSYPSVFVSSQFSYKPIILQAYRIPSSFSNLRLSFACSIAPNSWVIQPAIFIQAQLLIEYHLLLLLDRIEASLKIREQLHLSHRNLYRITYRVNSHSGISFVCSTCLVYASRELERMIITFFRSESVWDRGYETKIIRPSFQRRNRTD